MTIRYKLKYIKQIIIYKYIKENKRKLNFFCLDVLIIFYYNLKYFYYIITFKINFIIDDRKQIKSIIHLNFCNEIIWKFKQIVYIFIYIFNLSLTDLNNLFS